MASSSSSRLQAVALCTKIAHAPTPFLGAFLAVHLSAPIVANIGGASMSSSAMLLGREYYQGIPHEALFLFGPLAVHVAAAALKRVLSGSPRTSPRPLSSALSLSGFAIMLLIPSHMFTHRVLPMSAETPITSLGPAQLDFSFVQRALQRFPSRSALAYGVLAGVALVHWLEGASLLYDSYAAKRDEPKRWTIGRVGQRRVVWVVGASLVAGGLWALWKEPIAMPLPSLLARYDAVLDKSVIYR